LGHTNYSRIVNERTIAKGIDTLPNERLQIKLIIPEANIINILVVADSEGVGCYKKAILDHSGFSTNVNINLGILGLTSGSSTSKKFSDLSVGVGLNF
jgi:hypothetical protein